MKNLEDTCKIFNRILDIMNAYFSHPKYKNKEFHTFSANKEMHQNKFDDWTNRLKEMGYQVSHQSMDEETEKFTIKRKII